MATPRPVAANIDEYIAAFSPEVRAVLEQVRRTVRDAAPDAEETISYRIPAFRRHGILVYFAAFRHHIGFYPPVRGNAALVKAVARYAGEKGNLRFPFDQPVPYDLIGRITRMRVAQDEAAAAAKRRKRRA